MSRRPAFAQAYTHEAAFAAKMAQTFGAPEGIPPGMRAILDRLDASRGKTGPSLTERLEAIRQVTEEEAGHAQGTPRPRA